jgi:hypothetical protein
VTRPGAIIGTRHRKLPTSGRVGVWGVARAGAVLGAVGWMCMARVVVPPSYTRQVWAQGPAEVLGRACESETCEYTRGRYRIRGLPGVVCGQCRDHLLLAHCVAAQKCRERLARAASAPALLNDRESKVEGTSPWWPFACGYVCPLRSICELRPMTWRCSAVCCSADVQMAVHATPHQALCSGLPAPSACLDQLKSERSVCLQRVASVPRARHPDLHPPRTLRHTTARQRSCAKGGRTRVPRRPDSTPVANGRPCIGTSRLTTGDRMVRRTAATAVHSTTATTIKKQSSSFGSGLQCRAGRVDRASAP